MEYSNTVKIKLDSGAEALVYEESVPAWESVGAKVVKTKDAPEVEEGSAGQPNTGQLTADLETDEDTENK